MNRSVIEFGLRWIGQQDVGEIGSGGCFGNADGFKTVFLSGGPRWSRWVAYSNDQIKPAVAHAQRLRSTLDSVADDGNFLSC